MVEVREVLARCASCGHPLEGRYCSQCGEELLDRHKLTVWYFLTRTLVPEIVNLDGKIWRTLRSLLFRPAFLALEYSTGRRRLYVKPVRVLIAAIIVYALSTQSGLNVSLRVGQVRLSLAPTSMPLTRSVEGTLDQIDRFGVLERMFRERVGPVETASDDIRNRFNGALDRFATPLSFTTVLLLALALYASFHRRRPLLVEHAVFSMHYFSFVLLSTLPGIVAIKLGALSSVFATLLLLNVLIGWQFVYLTFAVRRFYSPLYRRKLLAWVIAVAVAIFIYLLNSVFITGVQLAAGAIAIWRL